MLKLGRYWPWKTVLSHLKQRQPLNEDVFGASVLCFFIASFKRYYDKYLLWFFFTFRWSLNRLMSFFSLPKRDSKSLSLCSYIHWMKDISQAIIGTFFKRLFSNMVGWVAFKVSLLKFKPFKMWRPVSLFILLRFLLWVWKVIFTRTVRKALNAISDKNKT